MGSVTAAYGMPAMWGAVIIGGLIEGVVGAARLMSKIRKLIPPVVVGSVVAAIGFVAAKLAVSWAFSSSDPLLLGMALGSFVLCLIFKFKGKGAFLGFVLVTQMFPSVIMLIPYFRILRLYGLINTHLGLIIVYISFQVPLCTWLMYSYFETIPKDLDAAAAIDGLNQWGIFRKIALPLSLPGLASTSIYAFINSWNEFQFAMVLTTTDDMKTVSVGLGQMIDDTMINWNDMMAASILASIPLILVFLFCQNLFFSGLTAGGVKQ